MIGRFIPKNEFLQNVMTLMSGTFIAQSIPILISPILTRLYSPADFGLLAIYMSVVAIISIVSTGRYELAIMLAERDVEGLNLLVVSIGLSFLTSLVVGGVVFFFREHFLILLGQDTSLKWMYLVPFAIFSNGVYQGFSAWLNRKKKYTQLSVSIVAQNLALSTAQIWIGISRVIQNYGLLIAYLFGQVIVIFVFIFCFLKNRTKFDGINKNALMSQMKKHSDFPRKNILGSFINTLASHLPVFLIGIYYEPMIAGLYIMAMKVMNIPMVFLGRAFSQVFYRTAVERKKQYNLGDFVVKNTKILSLIIALPMLIIFMFGNDIFLVVFGAEWSVSGDIAKYLTPMVLVGFVFSAQSTIMMVLNRLEFQIYFSIGLIVLQTIGFLIGSYFFGSFAVSIILFSIGGAVVYSYNIFWILKASREDC